MKKVCPKSRSSHLLIDIIKYKNIIEYTSYHVNFNEHIQAFMKVRDEVLGEPWPAWTAIGVTELAIPGARAELRVIAQLR